MNLNGDSDEFSWWDDQLTVTVTWHLKFLKLVPAVAPPRVSAAVHGVLPKWTWSGFFHADETVSHWAQAVSSSAGSSFRMFGLGLRESLSFRSLTMIRCHVTVTDTDNYVIVWLSVLSTWLAATTSNLLSRRIIDRVDSRREETDGMTIHYLIDGALLQPGFDGCAGFWPQGHLVGRRPVLPVHKTGRQGQGHFFYSIETTLSPPIRQLHDLTCGGRLFRGHAVLCISFWGWLRAPGLQDASRTGSESLLTRFLGCQRVKGLSSYPGVIHHGFHWFDFIRGPWNAQESLLHYHALVTTQNMNLSLSQSLRILDHSGREGNNDFHLLVG